MNTNTANCFSGSIFTVYPQIPEAYLTSGKNRQKIYNVNNIYLDNNQEFEIELYNPAQICYLAKISINGKLISNRGIILNPGERVFLERFINTNHKFLFKTYNVENTQQSKNAIANNGLVQVEFFSENTVVSNGTFTITNTGNSGFNWDTTNIPYNYTTGNTNVFNCCSMDMMNINEGSPENVKLNSIETGRVNEGGKSGQDFEEGSGSFNSWPSYTSTYKILPISQQPIRAKEIRNYCSMCKTRIRKQNWKFCPSCGEKLV